MKQVSYKVAKAIRNVGYPQGNTDKCYLTTDHNHFYKEGQIVENEDGEWTVLTKNLADIPTYIDVWLWLWKEKSTYIQVGREYCTLSFKWGDSCTFIMQATPEETIEKAIEYLVENDLIE